MKKPQLALAVLGGILSVVGVVILAVFLFFFLAGIAVDEMYFAGSGADAEMSMAAADMAMEREESAQAEAPASVAASPERRIAVAAPVASAGQADGAYVIRNGSLALVVDSPASALQDVQLVVNSIPGAFVAKAEVRQAGDTQPTMLTLRVPAESFDRALAALRGIALEVLAEQTTARDVTEEYTDLDARLRNLQASETQLLALVERSTTVEDLLKVENRLAEVRGEIETLQGRLNVLADRIALATIHVALHAPPDVSVVMAAERLPAAHAVSAFTLAFRNDGSVAARDVWLILRVPDRLSVVDIDFGGRYDPTAREIRWTLGDLAPGGNGLLFVQLRVDNAESDIVLRAEIRSTSADADTANNSANLTLSFAPNLTLEIEGPAAGAQGNEVPIWIAYHNVGTADATDVTIEANLPPGLTFVRADFGGSFATKPDTVEWKLGRVQAGRGGQVLMYVRVDVAEGRLQIPVSVSAEQADAVDFNNRTDAYLTALREDLSERSIWNPGQTFRASVDALVVVARTAVNVLIWVLTFAVPLAVIALVAFGVIAGVRRLRWKKGI